MNNGVTKSILVIKDTQSNLIEEAIFILKKGNGKLEENEKCLVKSKRDGEYLLKEAEMIINNYIKENKKSIVTDEKPASKNKRFNNKFFTNLVINIALIGSITFLIFIITRFL